MSAVMEQVSNGLVGARLDKYEVIEEVGYGGMSVVYRARDAVLEREVALKSLHAHLAKREESRRRFQREARAVAKLRHPNIVEIYDFSSEESAHSYIVTEFIHGPTLREHVDEQGVGFPEIGAMIGLLVGEAIAHAHLLGVIHRDVKPENVMIRDDGVVKLMDFGIAQVREAERVTETGSLLGSPAHMAPEVVSGDEPDARSDIFSFGTVLYFITTGELPFTGRNAAVVLRRIVEADFVDPEIQEPRIGRSLGAIIRRCMAEKPADRYESISAVVDELREYLAELGRVDVQSEVKQYFADPETYTGEFRTKLLHTLETQAREALDSRQIARAADCLNRLLAIDEHHETGRRLMRRLDRRRRLAGVGLAAAGLLALVAIVSLAAGVFADDPADETGGEGVRSDGDSPMLVAGPREGTGGAVTPEAVDAAADEAGGPIEGAMAAAELASIAFVEVLVDARLGARAQAEAMARRSQEIAELVERQERRDRRRIEDEVVGRGGDDERRRAFADEAAAGGSGPGEGGRGVDGVEGVEDVAAVEQRLVNVVLRPNLPVVNIAVDGEPVGDWAEVASGIRLPPGEYDIEYSHQWIQTYTQHIEVPDDGPTELDVRPVVLRWKPAQLRVEAYDGEERIEGHVLIDEESVGPTGVDIEVAINTLQPPRYATVTIIAERDGEDGARLLQRQVEFRPGEDERLRADFSTIR